VAATEEGRSLVTYDQRTIVPLLRLWGELGRSHAGVPFVHLRTILPHGVGGLARALAELDRGLGQLDGTSRTVFLERNPCR
jgi:hypothetical protein